MKQFLSVFLAVLLSLILYTVASFFIPWEQISWGTLAWKPARTITVSGQATSKEKNQIATFNAGANSVKDNKQDAINEVNNKIQSVIEAAKSFGIKTEDIKTEYINVYQNQEQYYEDNRQKTRPGQWNVSNSVSLILRDVARASALTDVLSKAGATSINGPQFSMGETADMENALLADAITDATKKAELIAKGAGKKLGKIITIAEGGNGIVTRPILMESGGGGGGMEAGTATVQTSVTVMFELR